MRFFWMDGLKDQSKSSSVFSSRKQRRLHAAGDQPLLTHRQFILEDQLQELGVAEVVAGGLLQPHVQRSGPGPRAAVA